MDYPIQSPGQLASHLRSLRKTRSMSQSQLGALLGVGQTRITRIEHDPAVVSVEQFLALLNALGVQMVLRSTPAEVSSQGVSRAAAPVAAARKRSASEDPW